MRNERGIALILVILITVVIVAVTLQINAASRVQVYEGANMGDGIMLEYIAKSGIHLGIALLKEEEGGVVSFQDDWFQAEEVSLLSATFFETGHFEVVITDESGKIPINYLIDGNNVRPALRDLLVRFLSLPDFGLSEQDAYDIVDSLADWIDEDDELTGFGAETGYYRSLDSPYDCKNGPLDSLEELLLIKGISRDLYYGSGDRPGIRSFVTLYGTGRININTAPLPVLKALAPDITDEMAFRMDTYRREDDRTLSNPSWYGDIAGMGDINIDPNLIGVQSNFFSIESTGRMERMRRRLTAVVEREKPGSVPVVISWVVH